jgi:cytochrome c biogenesis protein CcmG/thiol:disulfide interchange protein DsbE
VQRKIVLFALMVVVIAGLLAVAKYRSKYSGHSARNAVATAPGHPAPDFVLADLQGHTVKLSDLRGKAVVLNFWATWCPPCKQEIPWFVDLQKRYGSEGLQIVGVAMDDSGQEDVQKFAAENAINYPILLGQEEVAEEYGGINYLPTTFYIDRNGVVINRVFGEADRGEIEQNVKRALASTAQPRS